MTNTKQGKYKTGIQPEEHDTVYSCGCFAYSILTTNGEMAGWIQCTLHASAPELLEALKEVKKQYPEWLKSWDLVDNAIDRAEGRV